MTAPDPSAADARREEVALLPCPFCGGEATVSTYETESLWSHNIVTYTQVGCPECDYHFASEEGQEVESVERWNTRATLPAVGALDVLRRCGEVEELTAHANEWLDHLKSAEPLARHTAEANLRRVINRLAQLCEREIAGKGESEVFGDWFDAFQNVETALEEGELDQDMLDLLRGRIERHCRYAEARLAALEKERGEAIEAVFAEQLNAQSDRLGIYPRECDTPIGWAMRVRREALLATIAKGEG